MSRAWLSLFVGLGRIFRVLKSGDRGERGICEKIDSHYHRDHNSKQVENNDGSLMNVILAFCIIQVILI